MLAHENKIKLSMDVSCDLFKDKCCASSSTNTSCSSSDFSRSSEKFSCDESLIVENELLKKEVICLTNDLRKCYGQMTKFNIVG